MRLQRTDGSRPAAERWAGFHPRGLARLAHRLNLRLVLALATVALVSLVVSGLAINQVLQGYFIEQTQARIETVAGSAGIYLRQIIDREARSNPNNVIAQEVRDSNVVPPVAEDIANIFNATVTIFSEDGRQVAQGAPDDAEALAVQGLMRDEQVGPVATTVVVQLPTGLVTRYEIVISEPFSTRHATLDQIQGVLIGAGLLALLAALVTGVIAARSLTGPIGRLRRVAGRVAQGELDERAVPSGILEIDELGRQFNVMADRLADTLRMLEADRDRLREFVADVSHELRTPIAALKMYNELQRDGEVDEPTRQEFLERSTEQIGRLEWMSTNLLDLSRIDAGIFPLDIREGDLRDPVQAVVQAMSEVAVARGISLGSTVPGEPVQLRFDRERMVQLVTNLVGNALKFTPRGGGVSVRLVDEDERVRIEVSDTGPGIPAEELPRVFERFYRGTNTGQARASGSGLGLAIVRSIVEMHDGEIDVASVVGEGTVVQVTLPREPRPEPAAEARKVNETSRAHRPARNPGPVA